MVGLWILELDMQGEVFTVNLDLKLDEKGLLTGTFADQMGMMPLAPVFDTEFDGTTFKADVKAQTPPDDAERILKIEAEAGRGEARRDDEHPRHGHDRSGHRDQEVNGASSP